MTKSKRILPYLIILTCFLFIYRGLELYSNQFPTAFSDKQADWGAFGDYANALLNVISIILLTWIGVITYKTTHAFNQLQIVPLLDFLVSKAETECGKAPDSWYLTNCSNAAARNIRLKFYVQTDKTKFESRWIACYSLNGNKQLELPWIRATARIVVVYCDTLEESFFRLEYQKLRGKPVQIKKSEYEKIMASTTTANYIDLMNNFENHVDVNIKAGTPDIFADTDDYIRNFFIHHKFNELT